MPFQETQADLQDLTSTSKYMKKISLWIQRSFWGKRSSVNIKLLAAVLFIFFNTPLFCERIRGGISGEITLSDTQNESPLLFSLDELVVLNYKDINAAGARLILNLPESLKKYPNYIALFLYSSLEPEPVPGLNEFQGKRTFMKIIPLQNQMHINIPLKGPMEPDTDPTSCTLSRPLTPEEFPLILTIVPVGKGLPDKLWNEKFSLTMVPVIRNAGNLVIEAETKDAEQPDSYHYYIDDTELLLSEENITELPTGLYTLRIESDQCGTFEESIEIKKGETLEIKKVFQYIAPQLVLTPVEGAEVLLNGEKITETTINITPGDHSITWKLDTYTVTRNFQAQSGDIISVSLLLDLNIQKN